MVAAKKVHSRELCAGRAHFTSDCLLCLSLFLSVFISLTGCLLQQSAWQQGKRRTVGVPAAAEAADFDICEFIQC